MQRLHSSHKDNIVELDSRERPMRKRLIKQLFAQHDPALRRFLRGRSVPREEIEDVVQELFTRLMGLPRLEERMTDSAGSVRSFLLTMANNLIVDRQRMRQTRRTYALTQREIEGDQAEERTPERIVAAQLELEAIRAVILGMPLDWRVALALHRFGNMTYEQISVHMGVTKRQVKRYLRRAMQRIYQARRKIEAAGEQSC